MEKLIGESKPMTDTEQLAAKIVNVLFPFEEIPPPQIAFVALTVLERTPALKSAPEAETQFVFNELCGAIASLQLASTVATSARYPA